MARPELIRKRMKRFEVPGGIRFITFSCQRRLPLLRNRGIALQFVAAMQEARAAHGFELFAWVGMPEHVHPIARPTGESELAPALASMKLLTSKRVIRGWRARHPLMLKRIDDGKGSPRFWQKGGGFDRKVRDRAEFCREVRYTHRNPVERGLVAKPEDWEFSSVRWWMGQSKGQVPCDPPRGSRSGGRSGRGMYEAVEWSDEDWVPNMANTEIVPERTISVARLHACLNSVPPATPA